MEEWKIVPGYENYMVSNFGRIKGIRGKILKPKYNRRGYEQHNLKFGSKQKSVTLHSIILAAFVGPRPDGMLVRHLDGDKKNNRLDNLVYGTHAENMADKVKHRLEEKCPHCGEKLYS